MHSLQIRFMAFVIAGAALFAALAGALVYRLGHAHTLESSRATIAGLVDAVEKTAAIGAYSSDRVLLQEVVDGLARNPLVAGVEVRASNGAVLARHGAAVAAGMAALNVERSLASPFDARETIGQLRIATDADRLEASARSEAQRLSLLMIGQTVLVALLLYVVAARLVSRPIKVLARKLREMPPGTTKRLTAPARHARDEIGGLIRSANELIEANQQALQRERGLRAEIEAMEAQYRQIFDSSSAGIFVLDRQGRLINGNPTALKVIGQPMQRLRQLEGGEFVQQVFARPERVRAMMAEAGTRRETVSADLELLQRDEPSRWVHCLISVQAAPDAPSLIEGVMYDITERKRAEHAVRHRAEHDGLTGLKNREAAEATIERFVAEAQASRTVLTLLYVDLDGFKRVNDTLGHKAGDEVLRVCAQRMQMAVRRSSDLVGRMGGDEFVLALNNIGCADPLGGQVAQRAEQLLHAADAAMYEVKRSGKNAYAMALEAPTLS